MHLMTFIPSPSASIVRKLAATQLLLALCHGFASASATAQAQSGVRVVSERDLRFGRFALADRGYREITPTGGVLDSGIFSVPGGNPGPAQFTLSYDRGNNGQQRLNLRLQLVFAPAPVTTVNGVVARLTAYQTDLPGAARVNAGQAVFVDIPNCVQRICARTFQVGGRLDITRNFGGASIAVPIPITATVISIR